MEKVIVFHRPDGGLSIVRPAPSARLKKETDADFLARVAKRSVPPDAIDVKIIDGSEIPSDRAFRNAWRHEVGKVVCDMVQARNIQREKMRAARAALFVPLDLAQKRAMVAKNDAEVMRIEAQLQELRDVTAVPAIDSAATPDDLKLVWPECLGAKAAAPAAKLARTP